jgi:hypothetical protein
MRSALVAIIAVSAASTAMARQAGPESQCMIFLDAVRSPTPRFADFPAKAERIGRPATIDLKSNPAAGQFRTVLRRASRKGPDFAGRFTLATFGCGAGSLCWEIVDGRSGRVISTRPHEIWSGHVGDLQPKPATGVTDQFAMRYRLDSTLLILLGAPDEDAALEGVNYYRFNGRGLDLVKHVPIARACRNVIQND